MSKAKKVKGLLKRGETWYLRFKFHGVPKWVSLETSVKEEAETRANARRREITTAMIRENDAELENIRLHKLAPARPLKVNFAVYDTSAVDANTKSRKENKNCLLRLLAAVGHTGKGEALPNDVIDEPAARAWFATAKLRANDEPDPARKHTIYRSANSLFGKAVSLFCSRALDAYRGAGCYSPGFEKFAATGRMLRFNAKYAPATPYDPAPPAVIARTLEAWRSLKDEPFAFKHKMGSRKIFYHLRGRDLYMAIGHYLSFGLRSGELANAKWGWWSDLPGYPVLDGKSTVKDGTGYLRVRALDPFFTEMKARVDANGWRGAADDFIIPGKPWYRKEAVARGVGAWLRSLGWESRNTNHALRAYSGSMVIMRWDEYVAMAWLRHKEVDVTKKHYAKYVTDFPPADKADVPVWWAAIDGAPALRVLPPPPATGATVIAA